MYIILDSLALTCIANLKNYCKKGTQRTNLQQEMNKKKTDAAMTDDDVMIYLKKWIFFKIYTF